MGIKRLGIMQPYFFPYIGYFTLLKHVDSFVLFDTVSFIRHGWIERNRVLNQPEGWQYISVPLQKYHQSTKISEVKIRNENNWKNTILAKLNHYKRVAPYYESVVDVVKAGLSCQTDSITEMDKHCLEVVCDYLHINTPVIVLSDMNLIVENVRSSDEWALRICEEMNIQDYWNLPGGIDFFDRNKYNDAGININFINTRIKEYKQRKGERQCFEPSLSIIDVMMYNSVYEINTMMDDFELL